MCIYAKMIMSWKEMGNFKQSRLNLGWCAWLRVIWRWCLFSCSWTHMFFLMNIIYALVSVPGILEGVLGVRSGFFQWLDSTHYLLLNVLDMRSMQCWDLKTFTLCVCQVSSCRISDIGCSWCQWCIFGSREVDKVWWLWAHSKHFIHFVRYILVSFAAHHLPVHSYQKQHVSILSTSPFIQLYFVFVCLCIGCGTGHYWMITQKAVQWVSQMLLPDFAKYLVLSIHISSSKVEYGDLVTSWKSSVNVKFFNN